MNVTEIDTLIIGAGQSGLAASRELTRRNIENVVLERHAQPGDVWRDRWDSLRLFTPSRFDSLADWDFPGAPDQLPTGREFGDYLDSYAERFAVPVLGNSEVRKLAQEGGPDGGPGTGFVVRTDDHNWRARRVIVAVGACGIPAVPSIASRLDPAIRQLHTSQYRRPEDLPGQAILVVGAGTSGTQLGIELAAAGRAVTVAGKPTMHVPRFILDHAGTLWFRFLHRALTRATPMGRRAAADVIRHGAPLIGIGPADLDAAGVTRASRVVDVVDGRPQLADGSMPIVDVVLWATGYRMDLGWIEGLVLDDDGLPRHDRGLSADLPGLAFMGLPFQFGLTSGLVGGVTRDAVHLAERFSASSGVPSIRG